MNRQQKVAAGKVGGAGAFVILALSAPVIQHYEGLRTATYRDPIGIATQCWGHTGPEVRMGDRKTLTECGAILQADQRAVVKRIAACLKPDVEMPVETWAAFTSFAFNAGSAPFCRNFAPMIDRNDVAGACRRLSLYVYAGKVKFQGLVNRRAAERALCVAGLT